MLKNKKWVQLFVMMLITSLVFVGCSSNNNANSTNGETKEKAEESTAENSSKPATWIADRTIKGLIFMGADDYTEDMNPEILKEIKDKTGINYEINIMPAEHSIDGLIAGLAAGDLPDFVAFYLNNSGRPEMPVVLKAAREGMFADLTPLLKNTKVYSKYEQDDYLPLDTKYGVMFRPEFNGSSYFVHMNINRQGGYVTEKLLGGPFIRKDIADTLKIDPKTITTTDKLYDLAKQIKDGHFKDTNGKEISPIGSAYWGGQEVGALFNNLMWGADDQRIKKDKDGKFVHESQTDYSLKRVEFVQKLLKEKLLNPEFFTMEENRATEGALNQSFGIIGNMHNYQDFNRDMHYLPIGPLDKVDGPYQMQVDFKSGYSAWAIPSTTKNPEDIVKFADFLASREGKLLWQYGIEGRDYTLDDKGNPIVKQEVLDLKNKDSEAAKKLGFQGVGNGWGDILGSTDNDRMADFGEMTYSNAVSPEASAGALKIAEYWGYDQKRKEAIIVDGYPPLSFIGEFELGTELKAAMDNYNDSLIQAYYAKSLDAAKKILASAADQLKAAGLDAYLQLLADKDKDPKTKVKG